LLDRLLLANEGGVNYSDDCQINLRCLHFLAQLGAGTVLRTAFADSSGPAA
jgi:hypothetical protein